MTTFDTGNPLGSPDPRDLFDNAQNTDDAVNGEGKTWVDRFGRTRVSMKGVEEAVPDAIAARDDATSARDAAVLARDASIAAAGPLYANEAEGRAAVGDGEVFKVQGSGDIAAFLYKRINATESELVTTYPSSTAVSRLGVTQDGYTSSQSPWGVIVSALTDDEDEQGVVRAAVAVNDQGQGVVPYLLTGEMAGPSGGDGYNYQFAYADDDGNVLFGVLDGRLVGLGGDSNVVQQLEAYAQSIRWGNAQNTDVAALATDLIHVIGNGQSLMQAMETWPRLSSGRYGNLMIGGSVRPAEPNTKGFVPVGGSSALQALTSTVQNADTGDLISDTDVASLPAGNGAYGESPLEALANGLKRALNDCLHLENAPQTLVVSNVAVSGKTIEVLSKGNAAGWYQRFVDAVTLGKAQADALGKSYSVGVVGLAQGEYNYDDSHGGDPTYAGYLAKMLQWTTDMATDARSITAQVRDPLFITYQTSGSWTKDGNQLGVGMAQWRATKERRNIVLAGPAYPVTDKGGHLDSNGSRWLGWYMAKAAIWTSVQRRQWRPLEPVQIEQIGKDVYVAYRVPAPPLKFASPYVGSVATNYPDKGFRITDVDGVVAIASVEIVSPCVVRLRCVREPLASAKVWYASEAGSAGNGCLCDSDATLADDLYTYLAGSGMYPAANIPALVGKPYPLNNWSIAFCLPIDFKELS